MLRLVPVSEERERELKFDVPDWWTLPEPDPVVPQGGRVRRRAVELSSTYWDTADYALLAARLTLRRRTGDVDQGWQLKVPAGDARTEVRVDGASRAVPKELLELTHGVRRGARLVQVARLDTRREILLVLDGDRRPLVEIVVDDVAASRLSDPVEHQSWREVEVELKEGDEALLQHTARWLRRIGANPSASRSKLARTLGDQPAAGQQTPATVVQAVRAYLSTQHAAIIAGDLDLRRGQDAVHLTRVATRRYRSVLRVFGTLFDADSTTHLDDELAWYAAQLGAVRDLQVLRRRIEKDLRRVPAELVLGPVAARLDQTFDSELASASGRLERVLRGGRYLRLLQELHIWAKGSPLVAEDQPADELEAYVRRSRSRYRKRLAAARALDADDPQTADALHRARKAAKRARYVAELAEPVLGKPARKAARTSRKVQDKLGRHQDAVMAVAFLRRVGANAGTTAGENGFAFGLLLAHAARRGRLRIFSG